MQNFFLCLFFLSILFACDEPKEIADPITINSETNSLLSKQYFENVHGYEFYFTTSNEDSIYLRTLGKKEGKYPIVQNFNESMGISVEGKYFDKSGIIWIGKAGNIQLQKQEEKLTLTLDISFENKNNSTTSIVLNSPQLVESLEPRKNLKNIDVVTTNINQISNKLVYNNRGRLESSLLLNYWYASELITPYVKHKNNYMLAREFDEINYTPENGILLPIWLDSYELIEQINSLLRNLNSIEDNDKNLAEGKLKFLRAYIYFLLFDSFYNVPVINNDLNYFDPDNYLPKDVLNLIEQDLKEAIPSLNKDISSRSNSKINSDAAKVLLARVNLIRGDIDDALVIQEVIESNNYSLSTSFFDIYNNDENKELIWVLPLPDENDVSIPEMMKNFGSLLIDDHDFEDSDKRKLFNFEDDFIIKYYHVPFLPVFRYSEVLLIAAEVHFYKNDNQKALEYLNMVRTRANLNSIEVYNSYALRDSIYHENTREFILEGQIFSNMKKNNLFEVLTDAEYHKQYWPIPKVLPRISLGIHQNPGYRY